MTAGDRARAALRRHAPELAGAMLRGLGSGLENTAFLAGDLVVRVAGGHDVEREERLLRVIAARVSLPVPTVRFADGELGVLAYPRLPGLPLLGREEVRSGMAYSLGRFLRELHGIGVAEVAGLVPDEDAEPGDWLEGLAGPSAMLRLLRETVPRPAARRVLAHADLGAEHILEDGGVVTGVIDWTDAAVTDPALDFARLLRDFGTGFADEALRAYGGPPDVGFGERMLFFARCAALEDLAYGREHGLADYSRAAQRSIGRLFG